MTTEKDIGLLKFGNTIQLVGAIYQGEGATYLAIFPGEKIDVMEKPHILTVEDWPAFLRQTDLLETEIIERAQDGKVTKAIVRKSARQIEQSISWAVYRRDGYACRYCGRDDVPLTVDHLVLWEEGGPSIEENLLSACKKCNRTRGNTPYAEWLAHKHYKRVSENLSPEVRSQNEALIGTLDAIPLRVSRKSR